MRQPSGAVDLLRAILFGVAGGALIGAIGAGFRLVLEAVSRWREDLIGWAQQWPAWGWLIPVAAAAALVALARWLVKRFAPAASGSGVQHVEAVMRGEADLPPPAVLPVKFLGGALAIGAGMALGREGPVVQMGSTLGSEAGRLGGLDEDERRDLQAAVAGAGLAAAFNAPLGGAIFVFEELARRFTLRLVVATLTACGAGIAVSRALLGNNAEFALQAPAAPSFLDLGCYVLLGVLLGACGAAYNGALIRALDAFDRLLPGAIELRAAGIGACVGLVGWLDTDLVGGGEPQVRQVLDAQLPLRALLILFTVRWVLGPLCYSAGTPGGVFAPLLLVGAAGGAIYAAALQALLPQAPPAAALAVVGMAAFFAAVVRAPFTGVLLLVEMTASTELIVPLLLATVVATVVATLLGSEPLYDTLRERMLHRTGTRTTAAASAKE
jgi:CIC family chloride channel protein